MDADPPFHEAYKTLFDKTIERNNHPVRNQLLIDNKDNEQLVIVEECELPLIDLSRLNLGEPESEECKAEIARASKEWGFFQVMKHGISTEILEKMRFEQERLFKQPFHEKSKEDKSKEDKYLRFSAGSYRWGTPSATNLKQLSWSEAFHIPLIDITPSGGFDSLGIKHLLAYVDFTITVVRALRATGSCGTYKPGCELPLGHIDFTSSTTMEQFAATVSSLAQKLAGILAENMGHNSTFFQENCLPNTCYLRMNHYPPCPISSEVFGLTPHTDSDFLTILHQDQVGGLQLVKDGRWISVKPNPEALIINIGDLFQAWSNDTYKSVQHRVITNPLVERFSTAYFFCPSYDTVIQSCCEPSVYRKFSFREYREQVQADVQKLGSKIGLPRFLM